MNQGLNDQRPALQWIQSNIHYFGGNASEVTLAGESAGGISGLCQLKGTLPLFRQAVIQSSPIPRLRSMRDAQDAFDKLVKEAGVPHASPAEKLSTLRSLSWQSLLNLWDNAVSSPFEDPNWFASPYDSALALEFWTDIPSWCERFLMGLTRDEASLFLIPLREMSLTQVHEFVETVAPGLLDETSSKAENTDSALRHLTHTLTSRIFVEPLMQIVSRVNRLGRKLYCYEIAAADPFPGPLQG